MNTDRVDLSILSERPSSLAMPRGRVIGAYLQEMRSEIVRYVRNPGFVLPTMLFPTVFYLMFGVFMASKNSADASRYLLAAYGTFGVMAPGLFGFGVSLAMERETGLLTFDTEGSNLTDDYRSTQSGWYVQGVYQFLPRWRAGLRYDSLDSGTPHIGLVESGELPLSAFPLLLPANPDRVSIMLDWNPSEFSRLRAQFDWDDARDSGDRDQAFRLQYIYGIGAHGAHKF